MASPSKRTAEKTGANCHGSCSSRRGAVGSALECVELGRRDRSELAQWERPRDPDHDVGLLDDDGSLSLSGRRERLVAEAGVANIGTPGLVVRSAVVERIAGGAGRSHHQQRERDGVVPPGELDGPTGLHLLGGEHRVAGVARLPVVADRTRVEQVRLGATVVVAAAARSVAEDATAGAEDECDHCEGEEYRAIDLYVHGNH